jgi:CRP-like cAMP-binding protein
VVTRCVAPQCVGSQDNYLSAQTSRNTQVFRLGEPVRLRDGLGYSLGMRSDDLHRLEAVGAVAEIPAGHVLIERGQFGSGLYVILEGTVVVEAPEGTFEFGPRSLIGERALLSASGKREARVRAPTTRRSRAGLPTPAHSSRSREQGGADRSAVVA